MLANKRESSVQTIAKPTMKMSRPVYKDHHSPFSMPCQHWSSSHRGRSSTCQRHLHILKKTRGWWGEGGEDWEKACARHEGLKRGGRKQVVRKERDEEKQKVAFESLGKSHKKAVFSILTEEQHCYSFSLQVKVNNASQDLFLIYFLCFCSTTYY